MSHVALNLTTMRHSTFVLSIGSRRNERIPWTTVAAAMRRVDNLALHTWLSRTRVSSLCVPNEMIRFTRVVACLSNKEYRRRGRNRDDDAAIDRSHLQTPAYPRIPLRRSRLHVPGPHGLAQRSPHKFRDENYVK